MYQISHELFDSTFPTRTRPHFSFGDWLRHRFLDLEDINIGGFAKYLGIQIGPEAGDACCERPLVGYLRRCRELKARKLGFFPILICYRSLCPSVLAFVAQVYKTPKRAFQAESFMVRVLSGCGYGWLPLLVAFNSKRLGFPSTFRSLGNLCKASCFRFTMANVIDYDPATTTMNMAASLYQDCLFLNITRGAHLILTHL